MWEIIKFPVAFGLGWVCLQSAVLGYRLMFGDSHAYEQNRLRTRTWRAAILGRLPTNFDGNRDYRVAAGIVFDKKHTEWVEQGRLSAEAIASTLQ
jgi:hypothetical protein